MQAARKREKRGESVEKEKKECAEETKEEKKRGTTRGVRKKWNAGEREKEEGETEREEREKGRDESVTERKEPVRKNRKSEEANVRPHRTRHARALPGGPAHVGFGRPRAKSAQLVRPRLGPVVESSRGHTDRARANASWVAFACRPAGRA